MIWTPSIYAHCTALWFRWMRYIGIMGDRSAYESCDITVLKIILSDMRGMTDSEDDWTVSVTHWFTYDP